jgi:hypothetical protein
MKFLRAFKPLLGISSFAFLFAALILVLAGVAVNAVASYGMVYPTPETQSAFLKGYLPVEVIERFDEHQGSSRGDGVTSGARRGFASHSRTVDFYFVTRPQNAPLIANALRDDAVLALKGAKMRVADQGEIREGGYRVHYAGEKTEGTLTIEPVVANETLRRRMPLSPGLQDVKAEIRIEEKWEKK